MMSDYNGWTNYETWNVALWIGNDESLYLIAKEYKTYPDLMRGLRELGILRTEDGIRFNHPNLNIAELNTMMEEL